MKVQPGDLIVTAHDTNQWTSIDYNQIDNGWAWSGGHAHLSTYNEPCPVIVIAILPRVRWHMDEPDDELLQDIVYVLSEMTIGWDNLCNYRASREVCINVPG